MKNENYSVKRRFLAVILSLMMIFQMLPTGALADVLHSDPDSPANTWNVRFLNSDGDLILEKQVENETAIGDLPATIAKEDYIAYWAIGSQSGGEQGGWTPGEIIGSGYIVKQDLNIVPKYVKVTHTVTFYTSEDKTTVLATKTVDVDTSYCLNDIPAVPAQSGSHGKWVYSGGDFDNNVVNSQDTEVWPEYDQTVFTVTFMVDGEKYEEDTYYSGDALTLPNDPVVEGKDFDGWFAGETQYTGGEAINSNLTLTARLKEQYYVDFVIIDESQGRIERLSQYFRLNGEKIGTMPQDPFVSGKVFVKWVKQGTEDEVTADTVVSESFTAVAVFREVDIYEITAEYYYLNKNGNEVIFNTDVQQVEADELPYVITAPSSTQTEAQHVPGAPIYYPETTSITVTEENFTDGSNECTIRFKYVPFTAQYDFVYMLKNLDGNGYTEIPDSRESNVKGVLNSYVTPTVKNFDYAVLESAEEAVITTSGKDGQPKQELPVYYTRKDFQVSYETNGGSYVSGATVPYGTQYTVTSTKPTRTGYTFIGWYLDEDLTQAAGSKVTVSGNTTLFAKWQGDNVNYTIVYMFEKYNDAGTEANYVYSNSATGTGRVGTTVYASSAPKKTQTGYQYSTSKNAQSSVEIEADGSSVLFVYYELKPYTFTFSLYGNSYSGMRMTIGGTTYKSGSNQTKYSFSAKLGEDISSKWPVNGQNATLWDTDTRDPYYFYGWLGSSTNYGGVWVTKQLVVTEQLLPSNASSTTATYTAQWYPTVNTYNVEYWLQNADDDGYTKSDKYSQPYSSTGSGLSAKDIDGYNHITSKDEHTGNTYKFYYDRYTYNIDYFCGSTQLPSKTGIRFDANINTPEYNWTPTAEQCGVESDYTFDGWYEDEGLNSKYKFTTMPSGTTPNAAALVLYAKWRAPVFTVSYVDGDNEEIVYDTQIGVEKYSKVSALGTAPVKSGFVFDGWYTTADGNVLFDWNTQIVADTTIYAHWTRKTLSYTVHYVDSQNQEVAPDRVVSNPNLKIGDEITEQPIAVAGYRPNTNSGTIILAEEGNVITFIYSQKVDKTSYKVKYLIATGEPGAGYEVAAEKNPEEPVDGNTASLIEYAAPVDYTTLYAEHPELEGIEFYPDEAEKKLVLTANADANVFTFYYSSYKNATVTVNFVDMNGNAIATPDVQRLKVGKTFTLSRTPIAGWELNKAVEGTDYNGTAAGSSYKIKPETTENGLTFTLFYQKKATITVKSYTQQYNGSALKLPEEQDGRVSVEGLLDGDNLASVQYIYSGADNDTGDGRLNAGTAIVKPANAVIGGTHANNSNYYLFRYISGTLEVTKINVTIRIEPDRWTGAIYNGTPYKAGFTNPSKGIADYILISHDQYKNTYINDIWNAVKSKATAGGAGLGYYGIEKTDAGDYTYSISVTSADLPSDSNYSVSLYVREGRLQILPVDVTITTGSAEKKYDGTALTKDEASITGLLDADSGVTVTATGTITEPGSTENTYTINWGSVNSDNYKITENLGTLTVSSATLTVTVKDISKVYTGNEQKGRTFVTEVTGAGSTITTDDYTIEGLAAGDKLKITYTPATGTNAGTYTNGFFAETYTITNGGVDTIDFYETKTFTPGTLTITEAKMIVTATTASKTYDGQPLTGSATSVPEGATITYSVKNGETWGAYTSTAPSITNVGTLTYKARAELANYTTVESAEATLEITARPVTFTATSETKVYTGSTITINGLTVSSGDDEGLVDGHSHNVTFSASGLNVGEYPGTITSKDDVVILSGETNVTDNYDITVVSGKLNITPNSDAVTVTIVGNNDSVVYTGSEQSVEGYTYSAKQGETTISNDEFVVALAADKEAKASGTDVDTYYMGLTKDDFTVTSQNYSNITVEYTDGYLTITPITDAVTVTIVGNNDSVVYTGSEQSVEGYTYSAKKGETAIANGEFKVTLAEGKEAKASGTNADTYYMGLAKEDFTVTSQNYSNITVEYTDGYLTITPITTEYEIIVTGNSDTKVYNRNEQSVNGYTVSDYDTTITFTGLDQDDEKATAKGTNVGTYTMTMSKDDFAASSVNYTNIKITVVPGTLGITPITSEYEITVTGNSDKKVYNGEEQSVNGYTVSDYDATITFTGLAQDDEKATAKGTYVGTYTMTMSKSDFAAASDNYTNIIITVVPGILEVTDGTAPGEEPVPDKLVVTKDDGSEEAYQMGDTVEWTITVKNIYDETKTLTVTEAEGMKIVGNVPKTLKAGQEITIKVQHVVTAADVAAKNIRNEVTVKIGDLEKKGEDTVDTEPIRLTITAATDTKVYDGTALTNAGYELSAGTLNKGDRIASVTVTGAQTEVGSSANVPSDAKIVDASGNDVTAGYEITYFNGMLIVTERPMFILTIRYWQDGRLISTVTRTEVSGTAYDVATPPLRGYTASEERIRGVLTANAEYDVVYTPAEYLLTIRYQYQNGGEAAATYTETLRYGDEYSVQSPVIAGYRTANQLVRGTMPERNVIITVIYTAEGQATVITIDDFETPLGVGLGGVNTGETIE